MSELKAIRIVPPDAPPRPPRKKWSRLRRFLTRHVPFTIAGGLVLLVLATVGAYFYMSSAGFENFVRGRLIASIERLTGGRAEITSFHWRLLDLEADASGVVVHGLEAPGEAPYARIEHLHVAFSVLGLVIPHFEPRILLNDLELTRPQIHLIVYPNGQTNQPHPLRPQKPGEPALDRLFDLRAGRVVLSQGVLDYDDRAASFDFQNRLAPLDFTASDVSLQMSYVPASNSAPESFRVEAGAADLNLSRILPKGKVAPVHGLMQATVDLTRNSATLHSLRLTAHSSSGPDHALEITGQLADFSHPSWQSKIIGDLDMRLLDPITGYPFAPEGIAHLDLAAAGHAGEFRIDGRVHVDGGAYIGTGVAERGIQLDARVHADQGRLLITSIIARLHQGGQIEGVVDLAHWLPVSEPQTVFAPVETGSAHARRPIPPAHPSDITIPVDGKVTANFKDVALDTILDMVSQPPFQRLGLDARVNGTAVATWVKGDQNTVAVDANLGLSAPAGTPHPQEVPTSGAIEATYTQHNGAVDVRRLELHLPASEIEAHGQLGAYPLTSPTALNVDFHTQDLGEFDTVLRSLGLKREGRAGVAALPVASAGQMDFSGSWAGSLVRPRLAGHAKGTQLSVEMPSQNAAPGQLRSIHLDSLEADGSYASSRIAILHATASRGKTRVVFGGTLDAPANAANGSVPGFDADSVMHVHAEAANVDMDDVQPFLAANLPIAGTLNTQLQAEGSIRSPAGSGWIELTGGKLYGEPVARMRVEGSLADHVVKVSSANFDLAGGTISGSGSYDAGSKVFQLQANGAGVDLARLDWLRQKNLEVAGKLNASVTGSGTWESPRLEGRAAVSGLALGGENLGGLELVAHTAGRSLNYEMTSHLEGAELSMRGDTVMSGDYATQAQAQFSHFDIGALLKLGHIESIDGKSSLAGIITIAGPLRYPEQMHGEARLQEMAVTLAGVHLQSEGAAHATLADGHVQLDPLHITGENTDLRTQGSLSLKDPHQLDLSASGAINLKLAETLDPDLTASGTTTFQVEAHGPLKNPGLRGRIEFQNGSLSLEDLPNGLSQLHGTLEFNQNRLEVTSLTAMSGGGLVSVGGSLSYQHGIFANLSVTGKGIRIRYPQGVSSLADASLHLEGSQSNLLLSGNVLITRFTASQDLDIAALAAQANSVRSITAPNAPSNHVRLDVHVVSSPQLNFQNAFAKLAGDVDLHVRGTVASPSLLGRVSITQGNAAIAGTRYELQRGDITFTNPVRIEPIIDMTATAHVEDYDITLGLHGVPNKLAVTYRSDPPLPEADVVSLLALGHTENQQRLYTQQQEQALSSPSTDALLGGALNATVSNRVQKLFGAGSVKVDPNYLGAFGNSTSRITVQEQLGRNVILTYATDVNTTGQQLLQAEVAINRHVSLVVAKDESGVFSMVLKATRRYR
ncbi:MAG TPA: translocation/assembly module TamB domain-containing protein [Terracidiphilus sp.]|nr:translocation/assembly module TamB domain-containing protein [Terracidiphilus sp.]